MANTSINAYSAGGFIGTTHASAGHSLIINECWADTHIESQIGGGFIYEFQGNDNIISNCYSTGYISCDNASTANPGGGFVYIQYLPHITECYASMEVDLNDNMAAFVGTNRQSVTDQSFFDNDICPLNGVGTDNGSILNDITGLQSSAFSQENNFIDWNFNDVWEMESDNSIDDQTRPRLAHNRYNQLPLILEKNHAHRGDLSQSGDGNLCTRI